MRQVYAGIAVMVASFVGCAAAFSFRSPVAIGLSAATFMVGTCIAEIGARDE